LSGAGIKAPCREPWENKIVRTEETLHGNQEESRQEKETLSGRMLVPEIPPKASPEKHLLRGFSLASEGIKKRFKKSAREIEPPVPGLTRSLYFWGLSSGAGRARNAITDGKAAAMTSRNKATKKARSAEILIPDKLYFRIGEVASLCRLPAYVLRFWETEFPQLKPVKSNTGQRMYRKKDVESVVKIKKLLYEDGFTIAGARSQLREETKPERNQAALPFPASSQVSVVHLRNELQQILHILSARH
jgi:DNA-binding transcriptional MerR regulator